MQKNSLIALFLLFLVAGCNPSQVDFEPGGEIPELNPDYTSLIIPYNIAPLNFRILNKGDRFVAEISNSQNKSINIRGRKGNIVIPLKSWRRLVDKDRGGALTIRIYRKNKGNRWEALAPVRNEISGDKIDPYIAFRKIPPANIRWGEMGIYQRSLENFQERPIMVNTISDNNCMNCHTFNAGNPDQMLMHMRGPYGGTLLTGREQVQFVDTKIEETRGAGAYASWHPGGELIAFSVNQINQSFHSRMGKISYVVDKYSDIVLYDVKQKSITRPAELASSNLENLPSWSADGKSLFYICADESSDTLPYFSKVYNLMNISFNEDARKFGTADTLISASEFGRSITHPREAPTKDMVAFIGLDYGYFSIYNRDSDVYLYHLKTGEITMPGINSDFTESYPSWSQNGSWLMFVSKRDDGIFSKVWFSYIDEKGIAGKAFPMPQKKPDFYDDYLYNFNRPEFISGKVKWNPRKIFAIARKGPESSSFNAGTSVTISSGATMPASPEEKSGDEFHYHHD